MYGVHRGEYLEVHFGAQGCLFLSSPLLGMLLHLDPDLEVMIVTPYQPPSAGDT